MGWFANRRARAARETGVEASGAFCRAAGRDEQSPDVAAPAEGGSSAPQRSDVRGLTRLACGAIALLALSGVLAMEGCTAVSTDAENSAASEQAAAASASDVEYASFEEVAAAFDESALDLDYSKRDLDASYDASSATVITLSGDSASVQGAGAQASAAGAVISSAGTYIVSGELTDGQLLVDAGDDDKVQLVLAGATIHNEDGPAIYVRNADKCFVTLDAGTENSLSDGSSYALEDDSDEPYATLFSRCDLTLNGSGTLNVTSAYRYAVCSKDDLVVVSGTYNISAVEDGLRGRDSVKVRDGVFTIQAGGDGIKSNKDDDPTKGFVSIDGGTFDIQAGDDAVQGKTLVRLAGGSLTVAANDDAFHSDLEMHLLGASIEAGAGDDAFHAETKLTVDGGTVNVTSCNEGYEAEKVYVNGGDTHIAASDDGVNASAADLSDDADADTVSSTLPNGGTPGAPGKGGGAAAGGDPAAGGGQAPAGAQQGGQVPDAVGAQQGGSAPEPPAGDNAGGATDPGQQGGDPAAGGGVGQADSSCLIQINGGYLVVDSAGDAIDSNGNIEVTGGVLLVSGPTSDGDSAFDYDGSATVSGGTVLMVGSTGMAQSFTGGTQAFAMTSASGEAGQSACVVDGSGNVVASFTATKRFGMVLASSPAFTEGGEYTLVIGGEVANVNADGYTDSSTVSGGSETAITASCTASAGMGGAGGPGAAGDA
ncbi:carbohydrate-binding domain-containing protein [uncultured Senegalimassilia sp.]|uniref:carbohydrate-binding domain-containing protein n=1 Tax=uncultured Senegalimassilia sp. TaxID=1714350 RepID=UPI0025D4FB11|nr:carbohydrate-binding domain-containing protein [uncultured Senegalimassilia sp.]